MTTGTGGTSLGNAGAEAGKGDTTTTQNGAAGTQMSATTPGAGAKGADVGTDAAAELAAKPFTDVAQLQLAEGLKLDEAVMKEFLPLAQKHGLNAGQAQALVEFQAGLAKKADEARSSARDAAAEKAVEALKKDPQIGGAKFDASMKLAGKALRAFGGKPDEKTGKSELVEFINTARLEDGSMLGDNALFARFLVNVGARLAEDPTGGHRGGAAKKATPAITYPNSPQLKQS